MIRSSFPTSRATVAILLLLITAGSAVATGYQMFPSAGVSDKPQSKLWHHDGSWWAAMNSTDRIGIWELSGNVWIARDSVGALAPPVDDAGTTDALWDGSNLYIAAFDSAQSRIYKYTYDTPTRDYLPQVGFPVLVPMGTGSETMTIAKDGHGRLWTAYETNFGAVVRHTNTSDMDWTATVDTLGTGLHFDDIAAIVAYNGKVGVLWSNQHDFAFYYRWRNDTDPVGFWSATETVVEGVQIADDHINLAVDASGRVFAAMKDQFDHILVSRRNLDGTWTSNVDCTYGRSATRPIILVDESQTKLYLFYTRWPTGSHIGINPIEYRVANYNTLVFGLETPFIDSPTIAMNDITSTKQRLPGGSLLAIAHGANGMAYWNGWGPISGIGGTGGGGPLPAPPSPPGQPAATTAIAPGGSLGLAAYTFEEGLGGISADISNHNRTFILGAAGSGDNAEPDWSSGITGAGLRLNGINDYGQILSSTLTTTGSFTVECWIRPLGTPENQTLLCKGSTASRTYRLEVTSGAGAEFSLRNSAGTIITAGASGGIADNEWHHVAGVYDATLAQIRLYVDGVKRSQQNFIGTPATTTEPLLVGVRQSTSGFGRYFFGHMDQLRVSHSVVYLDNFAAPFAFTTQPTKYVQLTWSVPQAQGGIRGYNVFRSINASPFVRLNGTILVSSNRFNDATAHDGVLNYKVTAVDLLGQESLGSPVLTMDFEGYDPLAPTVPQAWAVTRHMATGGLLAVYPLDQGSGQQVVDAAGSHFDGTLGGTTATESADPLWRPGISGSSLEFDGSNDYVRIPDAEDLRIPGSMTIETWFKINQGGETAALIAKGGSSQRNYRLTILSDGKIEFRWDTTSGSSRKVTSTLAITDLNWHHVSGVYDQSAGQSRIYIDGVQRGSSSTSGTPRTGTDPIYLGTRQSSSSLNDWFTGRIDLVHIYSGVVRTDNFTPLQSLGSTSGAGYVTLNWAIPEMGLIRGYNLYRTVNGTNDWKMNRNGLYTQTSYTDDGPYPGDDCYYVRAVNAQGEEGVSTPISCVTFAPGEAPTDAETPGPRALRLNVAPNPFNPSTRVSFRLERTGAVRLALYDVAGRLVRDWSFPSLVAGDHRIPLQPEAGGQRLASGIYILQLDAAGQSERTRVVLVK